MPSPAAQVPRLDSAHLISLILECMFNGVFWSLFFRCNEVLWRRSKARKESLFRPIFLIGWALFCTITGHLIIEIYMAFRALIIPRNLSVTIQPFTPRPAEIYYMSLYQPSNVAWSAFYVATTVIADAFLIYRLFVVWAYNRFIVVLPSFLCAGLLVTGTMVTYLFKNSREPIFGISRRWILACFILTFLCNFYCTSLIALKLSLSEKQIHSVHSAPSTFHKIFEILVQSAALYCFLVILSLAFMAVESNLAFLTVAVTTPSIGIIFSMIVTRTHDHLLVNTTTYSRHGPGEIEFSTPHSAPVQTFAQDQYSLANSKRQSGTTGSRRMAPDSIDSALHGPTVDLPYQAA